METNQINVDYLRRGKPVQVRRIHEVDVIDMTEGRNVGGCCANGNVVLIQKLSNGRYPRRREVRH